MISVYYWLRKLVVQQTGTKASERRMDRCCGP